MKKQVVFFIALTMVLALVACGSGNTGSPDSTTSKPDSQPNKSDSVSDTTPDSAPDTTPDSASDTTPETEPSADTAKSLVVYFSWSGNTEKVAKSIQSQTGSDIFEIVPKTAYSEDYNTVVADAKTEQQNNARPEISGTIDNIDDYDTIYVGFPNWWGDMPMILF